jgi:hypothetical protein
MEPHVHAVNQIQDTSLDFTLQFLIISNDTPQLRHSAAEIFLYLCLPWGLEFLALSRYLGIWERYWVEKSPSVVRRILPAACILQITVHCECDLSCTHPEHR